MQNNNEWNIKKVEMEKVNEIAFEFEIEPAFAKVLAAKEIETEKEFNDYIDLNLGKLHSPFKLPDIDPFIERMIKAIENQEHIHIHGDYDADGVTSTALMVTVLDKLGAKYTWHTPHRMKDGYDIKPHAVDRAKDIGADLIVTVDCGIVAFETAEYAKSKGIDLLITDHHTPKIDGSLPDAVCVVNPARLDSVYPQPHICGCTVALKSMLGLIHRMGKNAKKALPHIIDFAAIGTVTDVMPMIGENRVIVAKGCEQINATSKAGLLALIKASRVSEVDSTAIGFMLGPRLNAVGRLDDSAIAVDLLLNQSESQSAHLAKKCEIINERRQYLQQKTYEEAVELIGDAINDYEIVVSGAKTWHAGLVGLTAAKIAQDYMKPAFIGSVNDETNVIKGSVRSIPGFNILEAMHTCADLFIGYGGHAYAAGFAIKKENFDELRVRLNEYAAKKNIKTGVRVVNIDAQLRASEINMRTYSDIQKLAPFGNMNPEPIFCTKQLRVADISTVGKGEAHLKMKLEKESSHGKNSFPAIWWRHGYLAEKIDIGAYVDVAYKISNNFFMGKSSVQLELEDIKMSQS